jgi:hypothetical protein
MIIPAGMNWQLRKSMLNDAAGHCTSLWGLLFLSSAHVAGSMAMDDRVNGVDASFFLAEDTVPPSPRTGMVVKIWSSVQLTIE